MSKKPYEIKIAMPGYKVGEVHEVELDDDGVAVNQFWRRRIRDAKVDGCVAEVIAKPAKSSQKLEA